LLKYRTFEREPVSVWKSGNTFISYDSAILLWVIPKKLSSRPTGNRKDGPAALSVVCLRGEGLEIFQIG
jgi:hypothetical protein